MRILCRAILEAICHVYYTQRDYTSIYFKGLCIEFSEPAICTCFYAYLLHYKVLVPKKLCRSSCNGKTT